MTGEGKKKKAKAQNCASVCVCASPVPKGSLLHARILECRGPAADKQTLANKAMLVRWMHSLINCVPAFFQMFSTMVCLVVGAAVRCSTPGRRLKPTCSVVVFLTCQLLQPYCMTDMIDGVANSTLTCVFRASRTHT